MHLLPGDRLWDRYRVERVAQSFCEGAWLSLTTESAGPAPGPGAAVADRFLLAPLGSAAAHPLAGLLSAAGQVLRLKPPAPSQPQRSRKGRLQLSPPSKKVGPRARTGNFEFIPLLGQVEWIGEADSGGVAIVAAPTVNCFKALLERTGPLKPAQALPILVELARSLDALATVLSGSDKRPTAAEAALREVCRLVNPEKLGLRQGDGRPAMHVDLANVRPIDLALAWHDFVAPELYLEAGVSSAAFVFAVARMGAWLLGVQRESRPAKAGRSSGAHTRVGFGPALVTTEARWAEVAAWAGGKRDPAREFTRALSASGMTLPAELAQLLVRCLSRRAGKRPHPTKLMASLKKMLESPWAQVEHPCENCGLEFPGESLNCPACGRELPAAAAPGASGGESSEGDGAGRPSRRTAALVKRAAGANTAAVAPIASEVAEAPGMTLIQGGSFLSGERKIPRTLRAFLIDTTPVTEGEFKRYLSAIGEPPRENGPGARGPEYDNLPVTRATWYEANAFAEHHGKRLPTVYEWEKAARGNDGRKFPYGNAFKPNCGKLRVNAGKGAGDSSKQLPATVGSFPAGKSPAGVLDMAGNVLEWTSTARRAGERIFRAVKGACFLDGSPELSRCTSVQYLKPETAETHLGFRCVKDVE